MRCKTIINGLPSHCTTARSVSHLVWKYIESDYVGFHVLLHGQSGPLVAHMELKENILFLHTYSENIFTVCLEETHKKNIMWGVPSKTKRLVKSTISWYIKGWIVFSLSGILKMYIFLWILSPSTVKQEHCRKLSWKALCWWCHEFTGPVVLLYPSCSLNPKSVPLFM